MTIVITIVLHETLVNLLSYPLIPYDAKDRTVWTAPFAVRTRTMHRVHRKHSQASSAFPRAHGAPGLATDWGLRYDLAVSTIPPTRTETTGRSVRTAPDPGG